MNRGEDIVANNALREHDSILVVVTLPRHVGNEEVTTQSELTILGGIALGEDVASLNTLTLLTDRTKVDGHVLVGATELRNAVFLDGWLEAYELFVSSAIIENTDGCSINILDDTIALSSNHGARILTHLLLKSCAHDRSIIVKQWHCLTHHVTAHQSTVTVIMLKEWDKTC